MNENQQLSAKRLGPKDVSPVEIDNLRFEVIHWGKDRGEKQNGGLIAAVDKDTGDELWILKVYDIEYDEDMESDIQDVFIISMHKTLFGKKLKIIDENKRKYIVDIRSRSVIAK